MPRFVSHISLACVTYVLRRLTVVLRASCPSASKRIQHSTPTALCTFVTYIKMAAKVGFEPTQPSDLLGSGDFRRIHSISPVDLTGRLPPIFNLLVLFNHGSTELSYFRSQLTSPSSTGACSVSAPCPIPCTHTLWPQELRRGPREVL